MSFLSLKWTWKTYNLIWNLLPKKSKTPDITKKDSQRLSWERPTPKVPSWFSNLGKWSSSDLSPKKMLKKLPKRLSETSQRPSASKPKSVTSKWLILWPTPKLAGPSISTRSPMKKKALKMKAFLGSFTEALRKSKPHFCSIQVKWCLQELLRGVLLKSHSLNLKKSLRDSRK